MNIGSIKNVKQVASFLRCDSIFLESFLEGDFVVIDRGDAFSMPSSTGHTSIIEKLYLRKKNKRIKAYRIVYSVRTDTLKDVLKTLSSFLKQVHVPSNAVHGYVAERNIKTNAEMHLAKRFLLSVDIVDFFGTITREMVNEAFLIFGFSPFAAEMLSKIVTIDNCLPPGYSTSPIISNMVVKNMDEELLRLSGADSTYTRYADDLYFSSNISLPLLDSITTTIQKYNFSLNIQKTKYMARGQKQYVTGLTVFDGIRPRITKRIKRNLRLELHYLQLYGLLGHVLRKLNLTIDQYNLDENIKSEVDNHIKRVSNRIEGWIRFMNSVEKPLAQKLLSKYNMIVN